MRRRVVFTLICIFSTSSFARVATSSLFPAIRSINPAAISDRAFKGFNAQASKKDIETTYKPEGEFAQLNWESVTTVQGIDFNSFYDTKLLNVEFYVSPKRGSKKVTTQYTGSNASESESELETIGLHFLVSLQMGKYLTLGAKRSKASTDFTDKDLYPTDESVFSYSTEYDMALDTAGYGLHLKLLNKKLHIGYGYENVTLEASSVLTTSQIYYNNPSSNTSSSSSSDFEISTKKTFFGVAFFSGNIKSHGIKLEFSRESMPPILNQSATNLKDGEASIYTAEMKTKLFVGGISYKRIRGVYLDTYDIIPFFLNLDQLTNSFRSELELSFTLRLAKKGSFGGIVLLSDEDTFDTLENGDTQLYPVNRKIATYGLSYSYLF
jgi:hypothetical protein